MKISSNLEIKTLNIILKEIKESSLEFYDILDSNKQKSCYFKFNGSIYFIHSFNGKIDVINKIEDLPVIKESFEQKIKNITIFSDGGASPNPGEGGSGLAVYDGNNFIAAYYGLYIKNTTNNVSELNALFEALKLAEIYLNNGTEHVLIKTDSTYAIKCITEWIDSWIKNNWISSNKSPVKNKDIIKPMYEFYKSIKDNISIEHVKAHSGIEGNEIADCMTWMARDKKEKNMVICNYSIKDILK